MLERGKKQGGLRRLSQHPAGGVQTNQRERVSVYFVTSQRACFPGLCALDTLLWKVWPKSEEGKKDLFFLRGLLTGKGRVIFRQYCWNEFCITRDLWKVWGTVAEQRGCVRHWEGDRQVQKQHKCTSEILAVAAARANWAAQFLSGTRTNQLLTVG